MSSYSDSYVYARSTTWSRPLCLNLHLQIEKLTCTVGFHVLPLICPPISFLYSFQGCFYPIGVSSCAKLLFPFPENSRQVVQRRCRCFYKAIIYYLSSLCDGVEETSACIFYLNTWHCRTAWKCSCHPCPNTIWFTTHAFFLNGRSFNPLWRALFSIIFLYMLLFPTIFSCRSGFQLPFDCSIFSRLVWWPTRLL